MKPPDNSEIAAVLEQVAELLEAQQADTFRVRAYRAAAGSVRHHPEAISELLREGGDKALEMLPHVGRSIAAAIKELVQTGRSNLLARLEGRASPEDLFGTLPGIGPELARRIHVELGLDHLEDLEVAAHDGRLERLHGFGRRRAAAIRDLLATRLGRSALRRSRSARMTEGQYGAPEQPDVSALLDVDSEYRRRASAGELPLIAPRRFNPGGVAWLPILHTTRGAWHFTALFSNTARAHELGTTHDWVVLYFEQDGREDQCTVVTERRGALAGRRVVRGREHDCRSYYSSGPSRRDSARKPRRRSQDGAPDPHGLR